MSLEFNGVKIEDTFAELFPMWASRVLVTAKDEKWCLISGRAATGFGVSIIASPAEAGIERMVPPDVTPDGRPGILLHFYHRDRRSLKAQLIARIGQCVLTCPTTAAYDGLENAKRRLKVGSSLRYFGDGYQKKDELMGRKVWIIPVMEGEFVIQSTFGTIEAVAGGNLLILSRDQDSGLKATENAVEAISKVNDVVLTFPGGICRSGSKVGSKKYKLGASTNDAFCPMIRDKVEETLLPPEAWNVYEIVINGLTLQAVAEAMKAGLRAAAGSRGVVEITAANYGGKLGPYKVNLKELLE